MTTAERLRRLPLRARLVAGFAIAMLVLLTAAGGFVYWRVQYALDRGLDAELSSARSVITPLVGVDGVIAAPDAADATGTGWQTLDAEGAVLDSGGPAPDRVLVQPADLPGQGTVVLNVGSMLQVDNAAYRLEVSALDRGGQAAYLLVAVRRDHRDEALRELLLQMSLAGLGALLLASLIGDQLARLALRPVERYRRTAAQIAAGDADLRLDVPSDRDDEVTRLGHTLNEMLTALEKALTRERQFVSDASHELRTPLTLLRSRIQLTRRRTRSVTEHEAVLDELTVDIERLTALAEQLLDLNRASVDHDQDDSVTDLSEVAQAGVERWGLAHPEIRGEVLLTASGGPIRLNVDRQSLERILTNLLANALQHGRPPVRVVVRRDNGYAVLSVTDSGPGMSPDLLARATRRFKRAPEARSRPGSGLGLALVEQLIGRYHGELRLCSGGLHVSSGTASGLSCSHDDTMTASVLLPLG